MLRLFRPRMGQAQIPFDLESEAAVTEINASLAENLAKERRQTVASSAPKPTPSRSGLRTTARRGKFFPFLERKHGRPERALTEQGTETPSESSSSRDSEQCGGRFQGRIDERQHPRVWPSKMSWNFPDAIN